MKLPLLIQRVLLAGFPLWLANILVLFHLPVLLVIILVSIYLLVMPGWLILSLITRHRMPLMPGLSYSLGLSLLALMVTGLLVSFVGQHLGMTNPLTTVPILASVDAMILGLIAAVHLTREKLTSFILPHYNRGDIALWASSLAVPILAAGGATTLNNGGSAWLALTTLGAAVAVAVATIIVAKRREESIPGLVIANLGLALLFMTSLRGWFITGHDTQLEYFVFQLTKTNKLWDIAAYRDPYNACLSITILPVMFQQLLHLRDVYVYKLLYQIIAASMVFNLYQLARRYTTATIASLVALCYITFPTFATDMAMLNRQEIAFVFFSLALVAVFDTHISLRARRVLFVLLTTGMVLSHYSSSYVAAALFLSSTILYELGRLVMRMRGRRRTRGAVVSLPIAILFVIIVGIWNGPVTHTSTAITTTLGQIAGSVNKVFEGVSGQGSTNYSIGGGAAPTTAQLYSNFVTNAYAQDRPANGVGYYPASTLDQYTVSAFDEPLQPLTNIGKTIQNRFHLPLVTILASLKKIYALLMQGLLAVGIVFLGLNFLKPRRFTSKLRALANVPGEYLALSIAAVGLIVMQVVLPQSAVNYGLLRLFQQNLLILALPIIIGTIGLASFGRWMKFGTIAAGTMGIGFFLVLTGFIPQLVGGSRALLPLNNNGFYYDAYYTHAAEVDAFSWFQENQNPAVPVVADRYFSRIKLLANTGIAPISRLYPATIPVDSYVYLSESNVTSNGQVIEYSEGDVIYYNFPMSFLDNNKDLLYSSNGSRIYR